MSSETPCYDPPPPFLWDFVICSNLCRGLCCAFIKVFCPGSDTCVMRSANFRWVGRPRGAGGSFCAALSSSSSPYVNYSSCVASSAFHFFFSSSSFSSSPTLCTSRLPALLVNTFIIHFANSHHCRYHYLTSLSPLPLHYQSSPPSLVCYRRRGHANAIISIVALFIIPEFRRTQGFINLPFPKAPLLGRRQLACFNHYPQAEVQDV